LQQGETKFTLGGSNLLGHCGQRWNPAIGRIDNQRRARAHALHGQKHRVVGARYIGRGAALRTPVPAEHSRPCFIQFGSLCRGEKFLAGILGGPLEGRVGFVGPNAL
jgi:hypothetical protein